MTPTTVYLDNSKRRSVRCWGLNVNQQNVANALDNAFNGGSACLPVPELSLPPNLFGLTGGALLNALDPGFRRGFDRRASKPASSSTTCFCLSC